MPSYCCKKWYVLCLAERSSYWKVWLDKRESRYVFQVEASYCAQCSDILFDDTRSYFTLCKDTGGKPVYACMREATHCDRLRQYLLFRTQFCISGMCLCIIESDCVTFQARRKSLSYWCRGCSSNLTAESPSCQQFECHYSLIVQSRCFYIHWSYKDKAELLK